MRKKAIKWENTDGKRAGDREGSNNNSYYSLIAWWSNEFWQMVTPLHWTFRCRAFWMGQLSSSLLWWRGSYWDFWIIHWFVLIKQHVIVVLFRPNWWLCSEWVCISSQTKPNRQKGVFRYLTEQHFLNTYNAAVSLESFHVSREVFTLKNTPSSQPVQNNNILVVLLLNRQCAFP